MRPRAAARRIGAIATGPATYSPPPMDFDLTAEQREIQALTREIAEAEIAPNATDVGP